MKDEEIRKKVRAFSQNYHITQEEIYDQLKKDAITSYRDDPFPELILGYYLYIFGTTEEVDEALFWLKAAYERNDSKIPFIAKVIASVYRKINDNENAKKWEQKLEMQKENKYEIQ